MQLAVLNPGGRDREQLFPHGAGVPGAAVPHPPVNYHAYAACTGGGFYADATRIPGDCTNVLLVLRRDLKACQTALRALLLAGKKVAVTLKESGLHQVANLFDHASNMATFREICETAHGCLASTPDLVGLYQSAGARHARFIPTPYPVDDAAWNFSLPLAERSGIFIGTREWDVPSRNHAAALAIAASLGVPVTIINEDGGAGFKRVRAAGLHNPKFHEKRLPYAPYLRLIAQHRIVFQLDRSAVPGQVAGDSLLAGVPCVGGDGAIERVAYPHTCGFARNFDELRDIAASLLHDDQLCEEAARKAREIAMEKLSFPAIAAELSAFFKSL